MLLALVLLFLASAMSEHPFDDVAQGTVEQLNGFVSPGIGSESNFHSPTATDKDTLQYVVVMSRHGNRSPEYTYPNDPYPFTNRTFWPDGPSQLTKNGKQQMYEVGLHLRARYRNILNEHYYPEDNKIFAYKMDRIFMSVACLLAGLYPPKDYQVWNTNILWQPIPIWEDPLDNDDFIRKPSLCPRFYMEYEKAIKKVNDDKNNDYKYLLEYLSFHMGKEVTNITEIFNIWDTLYFQKQNGYKLPDWTKPVFPDLMSPIHSITLRAFVSGTPVMARQMSGHLLKMISDYLTSKAEGKSAPEERFFLHGGHDSTLQALFTGLGYESTFSIESSALMVFELHKTLPEKYTVHFMYFNNSAHVIPNTLDPPNCPNPCSLGDFNILASNMYSEDWYTEC